MLNAYAVSSSQAPTQLFQGKDLEQQAQRCHWHGKGPDQVSDHKRTNKPVCV